MRRTSCLAVMVVSSPLVALLALASAPLAGGCGVSPAVTVIHLRPGEKGEAVRGDAVKVKHGAPETYVGLRPGFYVVRDAEDWHNVWQGAAEPPFPATLDTSRSMLLLAVGEAKETVQVAIDEVIETGNMLRVSVRDMKGGEGCTSRAERAPFDSVVVPRIDKPVKFYVEGGRAESCGEPPRVTVQCRLNDAPAWNPRVSAQPGDSLDCETKAEPRGRFAVIDRLLTLAELPGGSSSKLVYKKGATRGAFPVDVFGTYTVRGEATDEGGRRSSASATVEALPPRTRDVIVQLAWTSYDASDDPETFPRVSLRALEEGRDGKSTRECSLESPRPELCEVKTRKAYTHMVLKASDKRLPLEVMYEGARLEKGPMACIQVYFDGARTAETCDRQHRAPDQRWQVGMVEMGTGKLLDRQASADAGADASAEGGEADAAPAKKAPPAKK